MSNGSVDSIRRIGEVAALQEKQAATKFAECAGRSDKHNHQLSELSQYREEYARRLGTQPMYAAEAQRISVFIANLDNLIKTMKIQRQELSEELEALKVQWLAAKTKSDGLQKLADNRQYEIERTQNNRKGIVIEDTWLARTTNKAGQC